MTGSWHNCQDPKGKRPRAKHQHECGGPNAFDIADTEMGHEGGHEIEHETDCRGGSDYRPTIPTTSPNARQTRTQPGSESRSMERRQFRGPL